MRFVRVTATRATLGSARFFLLLRPIADISLEHLVLEILLLENGFRDVAQRSKLADWSTDAGAVTMFPPMAEEWLEQVQAQDNWDKFRVQDFRRLHARYGVNWIVLQLQQPVVPDLPCLYQNQAVKVCRVD